MQCEEHTKRILNRMILHMLAVRNSIQEYLLRTWMARPNPPYKQFTKLNRDISVQPRTDFCTTKHAAKQSDHVRLLMLIPSGKIRV
jgi:hypothetical protein